MKRTPMTVRGAESLRSELKRLKTEARPKVIKAIAEARGHGDLSENAEYHAAREQQGFIEGRIGEIETKLANAEIIDIARFKGTDRVVFGATVELKSRAARRSSTRSSARTKRTSAPGASRSPRRSRAGWWARPKATWSTSRRPVASNPTRSSPSASNRRARLRRAGRFRSCRAVFGTGRPRGRSAPPARSSCVGSATR